MFWKQLVSGGDIIASKTCSEIIKTMNNKTCLQEFEIAVFMLSMLCQHNNKLRYSYTKLFYLCHRFPFSPAERLVQQHPCNIAVLFNVFLGLLPIDIHLPFTSAIVFLQLYPYHVFPYYTVYIFNDFHFLFFLLFSFGIHPQLAPALGLLKAPPRHPLFY